MKKLTALLLTGALVLCAGCGEEAATAESTAETTAETTATTVESTTETTAESAAETTVETETTTETVTETEETTAVDGSVMSYADYVAADLDTEVTVFTYVQAKQSWWEDKATVYTQNEDGAIFLYNMACSAEDYELLVPGTPILVTGFKSEWSGEVEIVDATFTIIDASEPFVATATDVTEKLADESLIDYQNQFVSFTGMTVEAANEDGAAFMYNWDGSGSQGDDLYFNVSYNGETYQFTVESYLCGADTEVYQAVEALNVGDVVDMEGFLYWYNGVNPHITAITVK